MRNATSRPVYSRETTFSESSTLLAPQAASPELTRFDLFKLYLSMGKPRIGVMICVTTAMGFFLGSGEHFDIIALALALAGSFLTCAGSAVLNNFIERESDKRMERTRNRPLPSGVIPAANALVLGGLLVLSGVALLVFQVNLLTGFLALLTAFLYVAIYTPLKKITWLNTLVGAVPGALPPVGGWAAASGELAAPAYVLFAILFFWQMPHFYAIAWLYRRDYYEGGHKMLPVVDKTGENTVFQMLLFSFLLIPTSVSLFFLGQTSMLYAIGASVFGVLFFTSVFEFCVGQSDASARKVLYASLFYLPSLLIILLLDQLMIG